MGDWIKAAQRLGVKPATLYAYVSRGMLPRRRGDDGRSSLFEADEVALLADHDLAASTFAARMAASVRADP